jgi:hypothetical protein
MQQAMSHPMQQPVDQLLQQPLQQPVVPVEVEGSQRVGQKRAKVTQNPPAVKGEAVLSAAAAAGAAAGAAAMGHSSITSLTSNAGPLTFTPTSYVNANGNGTSMGTMSHDGGALSVGGDDDDEGDAGKRAMRAERNRQSAAASRERKKHHIRELERRVSMLSAENAQLQVGQLDTFRQRIAKERELLKQNRELRKHVVFQDMKIIELSKQLEEASVNAPVVSSEVEVLKRPSTWSHYDWGKANTRQAANIAPWAQVSANSSGNPSKPKASGTGAAGTSTDGGHL